MIDYMKIKLLQYLGLIFYVAVTAIVATLADFDLWVTTTLMMLLPAFFLLWQIKISAGLLAVAAFSASVTTILFESIAYSSGLWYELSVFDTRVFGIFPLEIVFWGMSLQLLVIAVHEYFNDDKTIFKPRWSWKNIWLVGFLSMLAILGVFSATLTSRLVVPFAIWWLVVGVAVSLVGALVLAHNSSWHIIKKSFISTLLVFPIVAIQEVVSLFNFHWVFANPTQYLATINIAGELFPLDMILLLSVMVFGLVVVYECYLDDGK